MYTGGYFFRAHSVGAHLRSRPKTTAVEFSSNLSAIYTNGAQSFPPIFELFAIFDRNIGDNCGADRNKNCLAILKGQSPLKRRIKTESKSNHKGDKIGVTGALL